MLVLVGLSQRSQVTAALFTVRMDGVQDNYQGFIAISYRKPSDYFTNLFDGLFLILARGPPGVQDYIIFAI